ncbi:NAD(P)-dependent alcohol dehydrogenase [Vitiosangium sp. GDMCC 1.1324]|uniref:NAD(P)-dependent alcohol dehydrogenase n=1 Tax=Vitiosangium sp. (strain GDMCC 1.1324) TaxID=2138576 RepID=UPI000D3D5330|nr:NAD(P)-dependent alcohol dehydrogenase [Vitiosangium sp. GDMCC 1.1324]PTL84742.1 alcohol dehydrogenase [Vitiosangium sp. GDMCC 1.1324]
MSAFHGYAAPAAGKPLEPFSFQPRPLGSGDVEIAISHCGVCHSDLHLVNDDWKMSRYPLVPGHEIIGTVAEAGSAVRGLVPGQRVGVGWQSGSCGTCEWCEGGEENLCAQLQATCAPGPGGFADRIRVSARFAIPVPEALPSRDAAPLLCGGITVYTPLREAGVGAHSRVGIIGVGGLGHLALQFARAMGAEVTAFSTSPDKEAEARAMGAHRFIATRESSALKAVRNSFDFILSTVAADLPWKDYVSALRPRGTLCLVGVPPSALSLPGFALVGGNKKVTGSTIGSPGQLREMLEVAARNGVRARTEAFPLKDVNAALGRVARNEVRYRAVLEL